MRCLNLDNGLTLRGAHTCFVGRHLPKRLTQHTDVQTALVGTGY